MSATTQTAGSAPAGGAARGASGLKSSAYSFGRSLGSHALHVLSSFWTLAQQRWPYMFRGAMVGVYGLLSTMSNRNIRGNYFKFIRSYAFLTGLLYTGFFALAFTIFAPIVAILIFVAPGFLVQLALAVPHHAYEMAHDRNPKLFDGMFLREMEAIDANYASSLQGRLAQVQHKRSFKDRFVKRIKLRYWTYLRQTAILSLVGLVPVLGAIVAAIGQWILISEQLGKDLLKPFFGGRNMSKSERQEILRRFRWEIIGFCMPFTLLNAIPIVGGFGIALAQGATAHLVYRIVSPPEGMDQSKTMAPVEQAADRLRSQVLESTATQRLLKAKDDAVDMWQRRTGGTNTQEQGGQQNTGQKAVEQQSGQKTVEHSAGTAAAKASKPSDTGGSGSMAESWKFGESEDMGVKRQAQMGPTKMEADMSDDLRRAAGILPHKIPPTAPPSDNLYVPR